MQLEEIRKAFPLGSEVVFTCDDGETDYEWKSNGIVNEHIPLYWGNDLIGYYEMKVYNRKEKKYYKVYCANTKLSRSQILNDLLD